MIEKERLDGFLKELFELSMKYKIEIAGCGCDGSPWVQEISNDPFGPGGLNKYVVDKFYDNLTLVSESEETE